MSKNYFFHLSHISRTEDCLHKRFGVPLFLSYFEFFAIFFELFQAVVTKSSLVFSFKSLGSSWYFSWHWFWLTSGDFMSCDKGFKDC